MKDLFAVKGKIVLVTGGGSGIGKMIAQGFVDHGAKVYIASRNADRLNATARALSEAGECIAVQADLSSMTGIERLAADIDRREGKLDVLINNAGAAAIAGVEDFTEEMWDDVMDMNAKAVFFTIQKMLPLLRASASKECTSRVVNIVSTAGMRAPPFEAFSYSASKAAAVMITRHLAKVLASQHILVNAIAPGPFATEMMADRIAQAGDAIRDRNPLKRLGTPEDIAGCALFLASRASAWTTGSVLTCEGGSISIGS